MGARKKELSAAGDDDLDFAKTLFFAATEWANRLASDYGAQFADPKTFVDGKVNAAIMLPKNGLGDMQSIMMPLRDALTAKGATFSTGHRAVAFILDEDGAACGMRFYAGSAHRCSTCGLGASLSRQAGFASSSRSCNEHTPDYVRVGCYTVAPWARGRSCARFWAVSW